VRVTVEGVRDHLPDQGDRLGGGFVTRERAVVGTPPLTTAGKRGKSRGGMIIRFTEGRESDSFWECSKPEPPAVGTGEEEQVPE